MLYGSSMFKILTSSHLLGGIGETAVPKRFLSMGFQFDGRPRLARGLAKWFVVAGELKGVMRAAIMNLPRVRRQD